MANNPLKPAVRTPKSQFQTSENDRVDWKDEGKMATKFYDLESTPARSWDTSGSRCYGDAGLTILPYDDGSVMDKIARKK